MPSPSSYVEPSVNSLEPSAGVCAATMSGFMTNPPAASTTAPARTKPVSSKERQATPVTTPDSSENEMRRAGLVADLDAGLVDPAPQQVHDHAGAVGVAGHGHLVAAGGGDRLVSVGPDLLVAGEHQPLRPGLDHRLLRVVRALELEPEVLQPVEVRGRAHAVGPDLVGLGLLRGDGEVCDHLLHVVVVAGRLLHGRPAAEIEVAAGHARGSAVHRRALQEEHRAPARAASSAAQPPAMPKPTTTTSYDGLPAGTSAAGRRSGRSVPEAMCRI